MPVIVTSTRSNITSLTDGKSITVTEDGRIELAPNQAVMLVNGEPVATEITLDDAGITFATGSNELSISFNSKGDTGAEARATIRKGVESEATGSGFSAGAPIVGWIQSEPQRLATAQVAADGTVQFNFTVPDDLAPGEHTLQLNGVDADGNVVSYVYGVTIADETASAAAQENSPALSPALVTALVATPITLGVVGLLWLVLARRRSDRKIDA